MNDAFCPAKWDELNIWLNTGTVASCCKAEVQKVGVKEILSSPMAFNNSLQKIAERKKMLNGTKLSGCKYCWDVEEASPTVISRRKSLLNSTTDISSYANNIESVVPSEITVSFDNVCNLKCVYCAPSISSTWEATLSRYPLPPEVSFYSRYSSNTRKLAKLIPIKQQNKNPFYEQFVKWVSGNDSTGVTKITITGGEPLMSPTVWKFLDAARPDLHIVITTNLAVNNQTLLELIKVTKKFRKFEIWTSNESIGAKAEFIRTGLQWRVWESNLDLVCAAGIPVTIMGAINALAVFGYCDFLQWANSKKSQYPNLYLTTSYVVDPDFLSYNVLPVDTQQRLAAQIDQTMVLLTRLSNTEKNKIVAACAMLGNTHQAALAPRFRAFVKYVEGTSGLSALSAFPELALWYNSLND